MSSYYVKNLPAIDVLMGVNIYEGFMIGEIREGPGRYKWADGQVTIGYWKNGQSCEFEAEWQRRNPMQISKTATRSKKISVPKISESGTHAKKKAMKDYCVVCKTQCNFSFQCLNCVTGYCDSCDKRYEVQGFKKIRPPCKCMIYEDGKAVAIKIVPVNQLDIFDLWNVREVTEHFLGREVSTSAKHIIFKINFSHKTCRGIRCTTLCEVGRMNTVSQAKLFEHQTVQDYIRNCQPKPAAFAHLEKRWNNPEIPRPPLSLNTICYDHDWASLFTEGRQDVDSLEIKSFCLTDSSITDALTTFVPRQLDVGTAWSSVKAPPRYYTLCGPRPTIMVYVGIFKGMNALDIRNAYAGYLTTKTGRFFHPTVNDGSCMFNTVKGSIDTIILMNEWLKLVTWLHSDVCTPDSEEELEIGKMKLMHIIYHGWKSHPDQIQNGFTTENLFDNCRKQNLTSFDTSFDLAQQYIANSSDVLTDANCTSIIRIPVFGFADEMVIPGFRQTKSVQKKSTFGMFGPIPGESKMGSIMMERSDADASIFPKNVSRVKIYPSVVNFIKQALAPPQVLKRRLTNQQLNTFANNVCDKYLSKLSSPTCRHFKNILMSFRIECTMHLDEENFCLDKVKLQFQEMTKDILKKLQQQIRVTMIAVEDISNIATFCLGRYYKMCLGNGSTLFRDQKMARAMVLSLWHIVGYHCHKATTDEHKYYLINVDMDDFETVAEAPIKILKSRGKQQNTCRNWSQTPMEAIQLVIGALKFMNLYEKKKNDSGTQWYYMYRKVCDIVVGQDTCPWCYSSATRLKKAAKSWTQQDKFGKHSLIACKSNHFSTLEELATDVYRRIEHHKRDTLNVKDLIESIFLPVQGRNKEIHAKILENILKILRPKDAASKEHPTIHAHSDHDAGPMSEVIDIDDQPDDTGLNSILNLQQALDEIGEDQGTHQKKQAILRQDHVLARYSSSSMWREALVHDCNDTGYRIEFWGEQELHQVSEDNIKHFDWDYCRTKMQSWRYNDFRDTITDRGMQVAEQVYERGLVALQNLCVGTVVADHTAFTSYDGGGRAGTGEQCNCEILWVNCPDLNKSQSSPREDNKVGFVVTTKCIQQGENLKWLCKLQGQEKEPNIMQSILFSMQGDVNEGREPFDLCAYMTLWRLQMPFPKKKHITISKTPYETTNFGSSIRPFLHQATIDLLLMNDVTNWLDIDANNSFIIHLAVAINKNPLALHTMFARNCAKKLQAKQDRVWTPDVLSTVMPSSISFKIMILEKQPDNDAYTCKVYGSTTHDAGQALESSVVLVRYGKDYTWLKDTKIQDVNIEKMVPDCHYFDCVKWETMTEKRVFIEGCHNSTREAPADWKENAWNTACEKVGLTKSESGKWLTKPPGFERDLRLQDGSLTPKSFDLLLQRLQQKKVTCKSIVDLGSEAGHAVAQFAFKPFVNKVIGIEIQYSWVAYSAIMIQHLQLESFKQNYYLADIQIIHGSFLDTKLSEWEAALSCADFCFCNNFNWDKGSVTVPRGQQALSGELKNNTNANVAHLLVDKMKLSSHVLVFDKTSFTSQEYQHVQSLDLTASWSTMGTTKVQILQMFPTHFNVLKKALQALCKAKLCSFESIPQEWWEHEVKENGKGFLRLIDHVLKQDHFNKSNSSVHLGWSVSPPMIVCIKKFPDNMQHVHIQREIDILKRVAQNSDTSTHNVIKFLGTDADRRGHTVLIFEMVDACSFESDLQTMTVQQIAQYMYMLLQALKYMHEHDIVHRDVKHQNFLHNFEKKTFRLIDFGSAVQGTQGFVRKGGGTRGFRAPETLIGIEKQTAAVDVWGAGIILLSLITGKLNILSRQDNKIRGDVCDATHLKEIGCIVGNSEMRQLHGEQSDEYGDGTQHENRTGWAAKALQSVIPGRYWKNDDHALDLLSKMLKVQPSKRITPEDALNHPFLQLAVKRP
jgi:hypothetical protein